MGNFAARDGQRASAILTSSFIVDFLPQRGRTSHMGDARRPLRTEGASSQIQEIRDVSWNPLGPTRYELPRTPQEG
jgi:hypothetical protein